MAVIPPELLAIIMSAPVLNLPVIPFDGVLGVADIVMLYLGARASNSMVRLFTNPYTPTNASVRASFIEATNSGLAGQPLLAPTNKGIDATNKDVWTFPQPTWTSDASFLPQVVYGFWVDAIDPLTGGLRVFWAQRFPVPWATWMAGQTLTFQLSFGFNQCS